MKEGNAGMGMRKHGKSGVAPKNKSIVLQRCREYNKALEEKAAAMRRKKSGFVSSVKDLFK